MKYFSNENELKFFREPGIFTKHTPKDILKYAIGANMYMPATQRSIFQKLLGNKYHDVGAITLCMEDSIEESQITEAQEYTLHLLNQLYVTLKTEEDLNLPLIFIRVRDIKQFRNFSSLLRKEHLSVLCGFTFPKFNSRNGNEYFSILKEISEYYDENLYGMPIIEEKRVMYKESRFIELSEIQNILLKYDEYVLNIRVGGTDFSSIYGLRRDVATTIYDVKVVGDCLKDIQNFFMRQECQYVVSGPVWEYYSWDEKSKEMQGLKNELALDIQNGFHGKTVIHPSQIEIVNKAYVVRFDEYQDALNILQAKGGVFASYNGNRMNEVNPHRNWAKKVIAKAEIFGVANINAIF